MNVNATQAELAAVAEVFKLAAILDDRAPAADKARIAAWGEQVHRHRLTESDLLDGVQSFYDSPSPRAIAVGDLIHHARIAKRNRIDREEQTELRHEPSADVRAADEQIALLGTVPFGPVTERTDRLGAAENALQICATKAEAIEAMREFSAAKREAQGRPPAAVAP